MPNLDDIIAWENGELDAEAEAEFFQGMINTGVVWTLQGMYGRRAFALIEAGVCTRA